MKQIKKLRTKWNLIFIEFQLAYIITLTFLGLKLTNQISWSWLEVFYPILGLVIVYFLLILFVFIIYFCSKLFKKRE